MEEDIKETTLINVKKILWDESENAPLFVLEDTRIFKPTRQNIPNKGWLLIWEEVEERWEDMEEA